MKSITYKQICEAEGLEFVERNVRSRRDLEPNQYYALMVTTIDRDNPYILGVEPYSHEYLIGIERPNESMGCYISKDYNSRRSLHRGTTIIVETENPEKYCLLGEK
jgi:hypothetical protein